jgi:spore germination protein YaaH
MELGGLNVPHFTTYTPKSWVENSTTFQITKQAVKQQRVGGVGSWHLKK